MIILKDRDYGVVKLKFLNDMKRNKVSAGAALLAMHVHAGKHSHTAGILNIPFAYMAADIGITENEVIEYAQELNSSGMILADFDNEILILNSNDYRESFKFPNTAPSIFKKWSKLPDCFIKFRLCDLILTHENSDLFDKKDPVMLEKIRKYSDLHSKSYNSYIMTTICASNSTYSSDIIAITSKQVTSKQVNIKKINKKKLDELFDQFYERYPRKVSPKTARAAWLKHKCKSCDSIEDHFDQIMHNLSEREKKQKTWVNGGEFVCHPSVFVNQERWNDEITDTKSQRNAEAEAEETDIRTEKQKLADMIAGMTEEERAEYEREELERERMLDEEYEQWLRDGGGE